MISTNMRCTKGGKRERDMINTILICTAVLGVSIFFAGAGIGILWMVIEDTSLGRAIDEIMEEKIERWKNGKIN